MSDNYIPKDKYREIQDTIDTLKQTHDWEKLKSFLISCSERYPKEYYIFTELSSIYYMEDNSTDALFVSQKAMSIEPKDVLVIYNYGMALFLNNKFDEAITQFNRIRRKKIYSIAYGKYGEGMKWAKSIVNDSVYMIGVSYMEMGDNKKAEKFMREHLSHRRRGIYSDFTKRQVKRRLNILSSLFFPK